MIETKFDFDLPPEGIFNFQQAGIALYEDDDRFVKLAHVAIWRTRQTEWAKEVGEPATPRGQRYGNTVLGPPGAPDAPTTTTWLRIVKRTHPRTGEQRYTGYSSFDGRRWVRGGTWTHRLRNLRIGLFAMGGAGHRADFDHVRVFRVARRALPTGNGAAATAGARGRAARSAYGGRR